MYRCEICGQQQGPSVPRRTVVLQQRSVVYSGNGQTTRGFETVREVPVCKGCETKSPDTCVVGDPKVVSNPRGFTQRTRVFEGEESKMSFRGNVPEGVQDEWADIEWVYEPRYNTYIKRQPFVRD